MNNKIDDPHLQHNLVENLMKITNKNINKDNKIKNVNISN